MLGRSCRWQRSYSPRVIVGLVRAATTTTSIPPHTEAEAFAIDFTRYRRYLPYDNVAGGTPVLASHDGKVSDLNATVDSGDDSDKNFVNIEHGDPNNTADDKRFTSRYLHMEGPFKLLTRRCWAGRRDPNWTKSQGSQQISCCDGG